MSVVPAGIGLAGIGSILGGAGGLIGGLGGLFGGGGSRAPVTDWALFNAEQNLSWSQLNAQENFQREMAQNSIRWRVWDANAAGISPLAALGAPTFSPAVSAPGVNVGSMDQGAAPDIGERLSRAGANIGDAIGKTLTSLDKTNLAYQQMSQSQQLKSNDLDLQIKAAQLARLNKLLAEPSAPHVHPASGGLNGQGGVKIVPDKVVSARPGDPNATAGVHPATQLNADSDGHVYATPTDPAVINNPGITNPFLWQWGYERYGAPAVHSYEKWFDRNITNPIRSMFGWPQYHRGD